MNEIISESASRSLVDFGVLNDNLIKDLMSLLSVYVGYK
jgi:hypothetical protein